MCWSFKAPPAVAANRLHTHSLAEHALIKHSQTHTGARSSSHTCSRVYLSRAVERVRESVRLHPGLSHRGLSLHQLRHHHHHTHGHTQAHKHTHSVHYRPRNRKRVAGTTRDVGERRDSARFHTRGSYSGSLHFTVQHI